MLLESEKTTPKTEKLNIFFQKEGLGIVEE